MSGIDRRTLGRFALTSAAGVAFAFILLPLVFVVWLAFFRQAIPSFPPQAFLDAAMEASAQEGFAVDMGYNPVVATAKVAPDLKKRIGFGPEEEKLFVNPDLAFLAKRMGELKDFWDKEFKA